MSVSRRIVVSIAVLMVVAFGALGYQIWIVVGMARNSEELSKVNFFAAAQMLRLRDIATEIENLTLKYFALSEAAKREVYYRTLERSIEDFDGRFNELQMTLRSWQAPEEVALLSTAWIDYQSNLARARHMPFVEGADPPIELSSAADLLYSRTVSSFDAVMKSIADEVERNDSIGKQAQAVSMLVGAVFFITGSALAFLMVRSINVPLQQLTRGTRSITGGRFSHRLPEDGPLEFAELARDFNKMTEKLGELDQMKKDFVSHVSHELKAPLAAILQTLAVTMEQIPGPINEKQRRLLQLSRNSAERLRSMVANLLDMSRLEAGTMDYEMTHQDLADLVRTVAEEFSLKAAERRIDLSFNSGAAGTTVICDRDKMIQVVGNLVDNALKFAPADSAIQVNLESQPAGNGRSVRLSVMDKGPGVPDAHKRAVFEKFHQVKGGGKRSAGQGVGLGLAICKTIVDAHRGRIWVEDNPGGGSIFCMEMQAAQKEEPAKCG